MTYEVLGNTAISEETPAGQDIAYEPEFEELQQEIDKLSSVTGAGETDWGKVEKLAVTILEGKSKHLLVAVYLVKALMQTRQLDGLFEGTQVLKDMIARFWDSLYPPVKRKKGRINALQWWLDQTDGFFRQFSPQPLPAEKVTAIKDLLSELNALVEEKLGEDAPLFQPLLQYVDKLPVAGAMAEEATVNEEAAEEEKKKPASSSAPQSTVSGQPLDAPEEIGSDKDVNRILKAVFSQMNLVAAYYREKDLANPLGYRLNRIVAWLTVDELPLVQDDGNTLLPPPETAIRSGIENQLATGNYEAVISSAEVQIRQSLFWFDLSRFTAQALEALGGKYAPAGEMVNAETALLVKRLPGVEKLSFSDGTPFADNETRAWLKTISQPDTVDPLIGSQEDGDLASHVREVETEAKGLLKKKEKAEAVALLQTNIEAARSSRQGFLFRMALVRLFMGMGKNELAAPHVEEILTGIDNYALETWDPDLAVQGLMLAYENALAEKNKTKGGEILSRIVKINPVAAFRMTGKM